MKIGIVGLAKSGKTTIFNALTRSEAEVADYSSGKVEPNVAVVDVDDPRVPVLSEMYEPRRTICATIDFIDFAGVTRSDGSGDLFSGPAMSLVKTSDALAVVVRNFAHDTLDSTYGPPDPVREAEEVFAELLLSDLVVTETRLERIAADHKKGRKSAESSAEEAVLLRIKSGLEADAAIASLDLTADQLRTIAGFQFLTAKPAIVIVNSGEDNFGASPEVIESLGAAHPVIEFAGAFEMELSRLEDEEEAVAFLSDLGIEESARGRLTRLAYKSVGLISFFTVGKDEVRAWTLHDGETAVEAAGTIHSDLARGFIRAECFSYQDLVDAGNEAGVRSAGAFRLEGKEYRVKDGDILNIRFSV